MGLILCFLWGMGWDMEKGGCWCYFNTSLLVITHIIFLLTWEKRHIRKDYWIHGSTPLQIMYACTKLSGTCDLLILQHKGIWNLLGLTCWVNGYQGRTRSRSLYCISPSTHRQEGAICSLTYPSSLSIKYTQHTHTENSLCAWQLLWSFKLLLQMLLFIFCQNTGK